MKIAIPILWLLVLLENLSYNFDDRKSDEEAQMLVTTTTRVEGYEITAYHGVGF